MTVTTMHKPNPTHTQSFFQYLGNSLNFESRWEAKPVSTVKPDNARCVLPRCPCRNDSYRPLRLYQSKQIHR